MFQISRSSSKLSVVRSIIYLGLSQLISFASPLLITPYLLRTIGIEKFGLVILAQTVMNFTIILTEYSFNLTSTQAASINRSDNKYLNVLYNDVMATRFFLITIGFVAIIVLTFTVPVFRNHRFLFLTSYLIVVGRSLIPTWFLLGIEQSHVITYMNVIARLIAYSMIFYVIKSAGDYIYVNLVWATGELIVGLCCVRFVKQHYNITLRATFKWQPISDQLHTGWAIFMTNSMNALYMNSGMLILSLFASTRTLGIYAVAEKVMLLTKQLFGVFAQATYPYVCRLAKSSNKEFNRFMTIELYVCLIIFVGLGIGTFLSADQLVEFFTGKPEPEASALLRNLAFVPMIVSLCLPAYHILVINNFKKSYLLIVSIGALLNVTVSFVLVPLYSAVGTVITIVITELFITLAFHIVLYYRYPYNRMQYF